MRTYLFILLAWGAFTTGASAQKKSNIKTQQEVIVRPLLAVNIKPTQGTIHKVDDLKLVVTITNRSGRLQRFLLDRPGPLPFGMSCRITNAQNKTVLCAENRAAEEVHNYPPNLFARYHYDLAASDWLMKVYPVTDLVLFDPTIVKKGRLPAGKYTLQLDFQGNRSNAVVFIAE